MAFTEPKTAQGAKKALTARLRQLPLAKEESKRSQLQEEMSICIDILYGKAKQFEKIGHILKEDE
jgi:hypothetical protein